MASTITAGTTTGTALAMSGDTSGNMSLVCGSTVVAALTATGVAITGTLSASGAVTTPLSYVRLNTANGYGSTNNKIRRFTNTVNNVGTDITYADSATLGGTFTINTTGVYSVNYCDQFVSAENMGISINSTQLTTIITSVAVADVLAAGTSATANFAASCSATFYAASTSVIRAHTNGVASGTATTLCQFTIARVA